MKKFDVKKRFASTVSFALMLCMTLGLFSAFPLVAVAEAVAAEENIYYPAKDYAILDADDMEGRIAGENDLKAAFGNVDGVKCLRLQSKRDKGYDPYVTFSPSGAYSADAYKYVALVLRSSAAMRIDFQMFYQTDAISHYTENASVRSKYAETDDWQIVLFDISSKDNWAGKIGSLRFDIFSGYEDETKGKVVDIAAIILCSTPEDAYDASFNYLRDNFFSPVQTLNDFEKDEVDCFVKAEGIVPGTDNEKWLASLDTTVDAKGGNLVYDYKFDSSVAHSGPDPYAGFFYHDLMDKRGVPESERLDTSKFRYTVVKYRTKGDVGKAQFQKYYFANGNKWPTFIDGNPMDPSVNYTASVANDWKMLVLDMQGNGNEVGWKGRFDGFRIDWAAPLSTDVSASMEISDIMFFADGEAAQAFVTAFNNINVAVPEEKVYDEIYQNPIQLTDDCLMLLPAQLAAKIESSDNSTSYVTNDNGIEVLRLETTKTVSEPYVTLKQGIDADQYKYVTVMARSSVWSGGAMKLEYNASHITANDRNSVVSRYSGNDEWTLITIPFDGTDNWRGVVQSLKLTYLCHDPQFTGYGKGVSVDIAGIAFSKTADAFYDTAYYLAANIYRPAQVITNFTESDRGAFIKDTRRTEVSFKNGDLVLGGKPEPDYTDPWASFHYKTLMDLRGVDASDHVTTADFNTTVIRYRTSPQIEATGMNLFPYTENRTNPYSYESGRVYNVSSSYTPTPYNTWRSMIIVMNGNSATAQYWTGDFNGFRLDWCGNSNVGEYMEISEFFFFDDPEVAAKFKDTVNSLYQPTFGEYNDEYMTAIPETDGYMIVNPAKLNEDIADSENSVHYLTKNFGVPAVRLELTKATDAPFVTYSPDAISADEYKYVTMLIKSDKSYGATYVLNYSTDKSPKIANQYATAMYSTSDDWQIITVNLSKKESWTGTVDKLKLGYLFTGFEISEGVTYDIAGLAFCKDENAVCDAAYYMAAQIYKPTQVLTDFGASDAKYFGNTEELSGNTTLSFENGNVKYTGASPQGDPNQMLGDPQKNFDYAGYVGNKGIKPLTTDAFRYTVIRYRAGEISSDKTMAELFIFTGSAKSPMIRVEGTATCHSGEGKYRNTDIWQSFVVDMAEDDWNKDNSEGMKAGWNVEGEKLAFNGFRFDWCSGTRAGGWMEVSDFIFFASADDAERFSSVINTVSIPAATGDSIDPGDDPFDDPSGGNGESESIPEFDNSEESESLPETETVEQSEESEESEESEVSEETAESETNEETDTDREDKPITLPEEETENAGGSGGSQAPFYIVCAALVALTVASLFSVLVIRIKIKNEDINPEETKSEES